MAKSAQSTTRVATQVANVSTTPNTPKVSAIVQAVQQPQLHADVVELVRIGALKAVKLYVTAGKREASARESATEAMAKFIRALHGDYKPKDIGQMLYGHGTTKSKSADPVVYLRSVIIYNAFNKVHRKGAYEPDIAREKRLADAAAKKAAKKAAEKAAESTVDETTSHEYSDAEKLAKIEDLRLEYMFNLVAKELSSRGYDVQKMTRAAIK